MFSNISRCETSTEIWKIRLMQLKSTLQTFKKGMLCISEYVKMKEVVDALTSTGQVIT